MPTNKTSCKRISKGELDKKGLKELHKKKMELKKAALAHEYNTVGHKRRYRVETNLSKKHKNHGLHPKAAY